MQRFDVLVDEIALREAPLEKVAHCAEQNRQPLLRTLNPPTTTARRKTILVLGVGRGGTSAVAGCLRELGVVFPNAHSLKHEWSPLIKTDGSVDREQTRTIFERINLQHNVWGWKSPADAFHVEDFISLVREPRIVVVYRNPLDILNSTAKHDGTPFEAQIQNVAEVQLQLANIVTYANAPIAALSYEQLTESPQRLVEELRHWLGLTPTKAQIDAAVDFVRTGRGYRNVSFEAPQSDVDQEDLDVDKLRIQLALYQQHVRALNERIRCTSEFIAEATSVKAGLESKLHEDVAALLQRASGVSGEAFATMPLGDILELLPPEEAQAARCLEVVRAPQARAPTRHAVRVARAAYNTLRKAYADLQTRKSQFQRELDLLAAEISRVERLANQVSSSSG